MPSSVWSASVAYLLLIVSSVTLQSQSLEYRSFRKEWKFQRPNVTFRFSQSIARSDNSFLFAICSELKLPQEINCNVTIETPISPWNDTSSHKRTCKLRLTGSEAGKRRHEITKLVSIDRFADDRALVVWWERSENSQYEIENIRVSILQTSDCLVVGHLSFPVDVDRPLLLSNLLVYEDSFDVAISSRAICGSDACRISHDKLGRRIGEPVPFPSNFGRALIKTVAPGSSAKGFYVCGSDVGSWKFRATLERPSPGSSSSSSSMSLVTVGGASDPRQLYEATSNAHELYGICLMGQRRIRCAQFDGEARLVMNATLRSADSTQWMAVHNLARGGLLLLTGHCNHDKCRGFRITTIPGPGQPLRQGHADLDGLRVRCSDVQDRRGLHVDAAEDERDVCFYFACAHEQTAAETDTPRSSVKFTAKCLTKSQLV